MSERWTHRITGGPWPERVGLRCRIAHDPGDGIYPWDKSMEGEVAILVEDDPHDGRGHRRPTDEERGWTCVIDRAALSAIPEGAMGEQSRKEYVEQSDLFDLLATTDAARWAEDFVRRFAGRVVQSGDVDFGVMVGWFANAIETGRSRGGEVTDG